MQENKSFKLEIWDKADSNRRILKLLAILFPFTIGVLVIWASMPVYGSDSSFLTNFFNTVQSLFFDEDGKFNTVWLISILIILGIPVANAKLGKNKPDHQIKAVEFSEKVLFLTDYGKTRTEIAYDEVKSFLLKINVDKIGDSNYGIKFVEMNINLKNGENFCIKHYCDYFDIYPILDFHSKFQHFDEEISCKIITNAAQTFVYDLRSDIENYKNGKQCKRITDKEAIAIVLLVSFAVIAVGFGLSCLIEYVIFH